MKNLIATASMCFFLTFLLCLQVYSQKNQPKSKIDYLVEETYREWLQTRKKVLKSSKSDLRKNLEETLYLQHRRHFTQKEIDAQYVKVLKEFKIPLTKDNITKLKAKFRREIEISLKKQKQWMNKQIQTDRWRVDTYGKVVDQYGDPVPGAEIKYSVLFSLLDPDDTYFKTYSDKQGFFHIAPKRKINSLSVESIKKNGYAYICNKTSFCNDPTQRDSDDARFVDATQKNPAIFRMRKKEAKPTFLLRDQFPVRDFRCKNGGEAYFSFILHRQLDPSDMKDQKLIDSKNYDLRISATYDESTSNWKVELTATGENGGLVLKDDYLSNAPEDGYGKFVFNKHLFSDEEEDELRKTKSCEEVEKLKSANLSGKYLYVRSRRNPIYTRIIFARLYVPIHVRMSDPAPSISIEMKFECNPFGERDLEWDDSIPLEISENLAEKVVKSYAKGIRPKAPNMKKLFEKFKKTHRKRKDPQGGYYWEKIE